MNKKYWISIVLDDSVKDDLIMELLDESYSYTIDTNEWVVPANPKFFDVIKYMERRDSVQTENMQKSVSASMTGKTVQSRSSMYMLQAEAQM